jgi:carbon-monoxide dehydrogenase large subunit
MDYCLPKATDLPSFVWASNRTNATTNPLGVKGAGEAGATAAPPAFMNAIMDALSELGIREIDMSATITEIWHACRGGQRNNLQAR